MKTFLAVIISVFAVNAYAWEDDYYITEDDALEAESYNSRAGSLSADYDNDGTPNYLDPYDDDWMMEPGDRDYDNDGTPNYLDIWDDDQNKL